MYVFSMGRGPKGGGALGSLGRGRDFKLTLSTKIKKVSSVKMLRHIIFHKRCLTIYNKWGLKCLKLPVLYKTPPPPQKKAKTQAVNIFICIPKMIQLHWISARFNEMGDIKKTVVKY